MCTNPEGPASVSLKTTIESLHKDIMKNELNQLAFWHAIKVVLTNYCKESTHKGILSRLGKYTV